VPGRRPTPERRAGFPGGPGPGVTRVCYLGSSGPGSALDGVGCRTGAGGVDGGDGSRDQVLDATPAGTGRPATDRSVSGSTGAGAGVSFGTGVGALRGGGVGTTAAGVDVAGAPGAIAGDATGGPGQR
jgi:hypothetical protein